MAMRNDAFWEAQGSDRRPDDWEARVGRYVDNLK
jgi:hypothetical protein